MISRVRLHQANRHARRRWRVQHWRQNSTRWPWDNWDTPWQQLRKVTVACSSACCGNPRRWRGEPTVQERRYMEAI